MSELQLTFLRDVMASFLVISSISCLAVGKIGLWPVGHVAFLGSGGIYAALTQIMPPVPAACGAFVLALAWAALVSFGAAWLEGDQFVISSLASGYAAFAIAVAVFGQGVRDLPGSGSAEGRQLVIGVFFVICLSFSFWLWALDRSRTGTMLRIFRDRPEVLAVAGFSLRGARFWVHFMAAVPPIIGGLLLVTYQCSYSANLHSPARGILLFAIAFPFGLNTVAGGWLAALSLVTLSRLFDFILASEGLRMMVFRLEVTLGSRGLMQTVDGLGAPLTEVCLGLLLILFIRLRPQGLLGTETRWTRG